MELVQLNVQVPREFKDELDRIKAKEGVLVAYQVRLAIAEYLKRRRGLTKNPSAEDRNAAGPIQDRPEMVVVDPLAVERESRSTTRPSVKEGVGPRWKK